MGVILRQGLKHSAVTLLATAIGMVNALFIYTAFLTPTEFGLFQYIINWAKTITPFLALGMGAVATRFYPNFQDKDEKNNGFLFFLLLIPLLAFFTFLVFSYFFQTTIYQQIAEHEDYELLRTYLPYTLLLILALLIGEIVSSYTLNLKRIVVPEIFNNLWLKITIPLIAISYYYDYLTFPNFMQGLVICYFIAAIGVFGYLWSLGGANLRPNWAFFNKKTNKEIQSFATFTVLGGMGTYLATQIDTIMVGSYIDMDNTAIYGVAANISVVIGIPLRSIFTIATPIIASSFNTNDLGNIKNLYNKSSINLLVIGILLFTGIWASVDLLFQIIPKGEIYATGKYIILFLGLAKLVDMVTSINTHIIVYSQYYKFNLYFSLLLAVINISLNVLLIPKYGLVGAAISTLISMILFNIIKVIFVWIKFKMQPFSLSMIWVLLLGLIAYASTLVLPKTGNAFIDIVINSIMITLIYVPSILYFNLSDDLTKVKQDLLIKVRNFF